MITRKMRLSMAMLTIAASVLTTGNIKADEKDTTKETNTATESKYANKAVADIYSTTTLNIRKKGSINAKIVGKMKKGNIATVLKKGSEWSKVRSGNVTGYVKNQYLVFGDEIENFAKQNVKKVAKVQTETLRVRKKASTDSKIVTLVSEDDKLKVKKQTDDWAKVKVDGQTGYVSKDYAKVTYSFGKAKSMKQIQAEQAAKEAQKQAAQTTIGNESASTSSSNTSNSSTTSGSTKASSVQAAKKASVSVSSSGSSATGSRIASYAQQFIGNPYRYGGNSLTNGIDCSGFTQQIMAKFGYSISRTSSSQAGDGRTVSTSNLRAGDLVFYGDGGSINHVALYIGGGQVVHASNSAPYPRGGIKISNVNYRTPICARRIIG
jgi:cell wall-associated NlpC family hydrolase